VITRSAIQRCQRQATRGSVAWAGLFRGAQSAMNPPPRRLDYASIAVREAGCCFSDLGGGTFTDFRCCVSPTVCSMSKPPAVTPSWW